MLSYIYLFFTGTIIGSFFSSSIFCKTLSYSPVSIRRSACQNCDKKLKYWMLVPIFSYLSLGGKCYYCKDDISLKYPLLELAIGSSFVLLSLNYTYDINQAFILAITSLLIACSFSDQRDMKIPDSLIYSTLTFALVYLAFNFSTSNLLGLVVGKLFFDIQRWISKGKWVGDADSFIGASIGAVLGLKLGLLTIFISYWLATLFIIPKLLTKSVSLKSKLAFIPFLTISFFLVNFFYDIIVINFNYLQ